MTDPEIRLMLKLEQGIHRAGWDEPARLYGIRHLPDRLRLFDLPIPGGANAAHYLAWLGEQYEECSQWGAVGAEIMAALDGYHGMAFVSEGWDLGALPKEAMAKIDRPFADIPGAMEVRLVNAVTVHGKHYFIRRQRGQKPDTSQLGGPVGRVPYGLTRIVLAVARCLPTGAADVPALETLKAGIERNSAEVERLRNG